MAKKRPRLTETESDLFADTTAREQPEPTAAAQSADGERTLTAEGYTVPVGVGLKESEIAALDAISAETGFSRHALMRYAIRHFILEQWAGNITLQAADRRYTPKKKLEMPQ